MGKKKTEEVVLTEAQLQQKRENAQRGQKRKQKKKWSEYMLYGLAFLTFVVICSTIVYSFLIERLNKSNTRNTAVLCPKLL